MLGTELLEACLSVPNTVQVKLWLQCDDDEEYMHMFMYRNELISWWLQCSPFALDSWKWLSGQFFHWGEEWALAAAKKYIHQTPGIYMYECG